jgi:hypothetical protein
MPLRNLLYELRSAMAATLASGRLPLAVALDSARADVEAVLMSPQTTSTRRAIARTHAEIALEVWRESTVDDARV